VELMDEETKLQLSKLNYEVAKLKKELSKQPKSISLYDRTIYALKNKDKLEESIKDTEKRIKELEKESLLTSVTSNKVILREEDKTYIHRDEAMQSYINELKNIVIINKKMSKHIKSVLKKFENDEYYQIIELKYLRKTVDKNGKEIKEYSFEEIAEIIGCTDKTIRKNKNRLLNDIGMKLFPTLIAKDLGLK